MGWIQQIWICYDDVADDDGGVGSTDKPIISRSCPLLMFFFYVVGTGNMTMKRTEGEKRMSEGVGGGGGGGGGECGAGMEGGNRHPNCADRHPPSRCCIFVGPLTDIWKQQCFSKNTFKNFFLFSVH